MSPIMNRQHSNSPGADEEGKEGLSYKNWTITNHYYEF